MVDSQINFIDSVRGVYDRTISNRKLPLYDTYFKLSQFTLCHQHSADLVKAIEILQPSRCKQQKHLIAPHKGIYESYESFGVADTNALQY